MDNITACIITNNDKRVLNAIDSVKEYCNEIILVETSGVNDFQKELIERNVKLYYKDWNDNFSEIRNYGIDKANGKWILIIDSDEVLQGAIKKIPDTYKVYYAKVINGDFVSKSARLFLNSKEIRYNNRIHETIEYNIPESEKANCNLKFIHIAYEGLSQLDLRKKLLRNYKILLKDFENPLRNYYLAHTYNKYPLKKAQCIIACFNALSEDISNEYKSNLYLILFQLTGCEDEQYLLKAINILPKQIYSRLLFADLLAKKNKKTEANNQYSIILELIKSGITDLQNDVFPDEIFIKNKINKLCQ